MMAARIGRLRHRMTLEAPLDSADGAGGQVRSFTPVATLFAAIEPLTAASAEEARRTQMTVTHSIVIRHRTDLTSRHRLTMGTRTFAIRGILDVGEERRFLQIDAEETLT